MRVGDLQRVQAAQQLRGVASRRERVGVDQTHLAARVDQVRGADGHGAALRVEVAQVDHAVRGGDSARLVAHEREAHGVAGHVRDVAQPLGVVAGVAGGQAEQLAVAGVELGVQGG